MDDRFAVAFWRLACVIHGSLTGKPLRMKPADFLPRYGGPVERQSAAQQQHIFKAFALAHNAKLKEAERRAGKHR